MSTCRGEVDLGSNRLIEGLLGAMGTCTGGHAAAGTDLPLGGASGSLGRR
jgi:hypothetical protein